MNELARFTAYTVRGSRGSQSGRECRPEHGGAVEKLESQENEERGRRERQKQRGKDREPENRDPREWSAPRKVSERRLHARDVLDEGRDKDVGDNHRAANRAGDDGSSRQRPLVGELFLQPIPEFHRACFSERCRRAYAPEDVTARSRKPGTWLTDARPCMAIETINGVTVGADGPCSATKP